jgi:hypothetical protein
MLDSVELEKPMNVEISENPVYETDVVPLSWLIVHHLLSISSKFHGIPFSFGSDIACYTSKHKVL